MRTSQVQANGGVAWLSSQKQWAFILTCLMFLAERNQSSPSQPPFTGSRWELHSSLASRSPTVAPCLAQSTSGTLVGSCAWGLLMLLDSGTSKPFFCFQSVHANSHLVLDPSHTFYFVFCCCWYTCVCMSVCIHVCKCLYVCTCAYMFVRACMCVSLSL